MTMGEVTVQLVPVGGYGRGNSPAGGSSCFMREVSVQLLVVVWLYKR